MSDEPRDPQLEGLLSVFHEAVMESMATGQPGKVTAYDAAKQKVSVLPLIKRRHLAESEQKVVEAQPEIHGVPVLFLGPPRARITWPVAVGDLCWISHSHVAIRRLLTVGASSPVDPGDVQLHDVNDCVAMVGFHTFKAVPTTAPTDAIVIHAGPGVTVKIGGVDATEAAAFHSAIVALKEVFENWTPVASDGGGALKTLLTSLISSGWPQGSTKVTVK